MVTNDALRRKVNDLIELANEKLLDEHMYFFQTVGTDSTEGAYDAEKDKREAEIADDAGFENYRAVYDKYAVMSGSYQSAEEALEAARLRMYDDIQANLENVSNNMERWEGKAVGNFEKYFRFPFIGAAMNQHNLINEVKEGVAAQHRIAVQARKGAYNIADATKRCLDDYSPGPSFAENMDMAFQVLGAVTAFAGLKLKVENFKEGTQLATGLLSSATSTFTTLEALEQGGEKANAEAQAEITDSELTIEQTMDETIEPQYGGIEGDAVYSIMDSMRAALDNLRDMVKDQEELLRQKLQITIDDVDARLDGSLLGNEPYLRPMKPGLVDTEPGLYSDGMSPAGA